MLKFWKCPRPTITFAKQKLKIMEFILTLVTIILGIWFFGWFMQQWNKLSNVPPTPEQLEDIDWHNTLN